MQHNASTTLAIVAKTEKWRLVVCYLAPSLHDRCVTSFVGVGRIALMCTDKRTNDMAQRVCDIIGSKASAALLRWCC